MKCDVIVPYLSNEDCYTHGSYALELKNLRLGTIYYARVYAAYEPRGMYSDVITFTTAGQTPNLSHGPTTYFVLEHFESVWTCRGVSHYRIKNSSPAKKGDG